MNQITLNDVIGMDEAKSILIERLKEYYEFKEQLLNMGLKPSKGLLLYGYPGTGKTMLINATINELIKINSNLFCKSVTLTDVSSPQIGKSDQKISSLFQSLPDDKETVLIMDEADIIVPNRARTTSVMTIERVNAILRELDGLKNRVGVFVIASTNRPFDIDRAFLRSGRIDYNIYASLPTLEQRKKLVMKYFGYIPSIKLSDKLVNSVATNTENWSGADYASISATLGLLHLRSIKKNPGFKMQSQTIIEVIAHKKLRTDIIKMEKDYSRFLKSDKSNQR